MQFLVLGPLEAVHDGRRLELGTPRARALLGILLVHAGNVVSIDQLVDELWPDGTTADVRAEVHAYVSRLRRALGTGGASDRRWLITRSPGYVLRVEHGELDLHRFDDLVTAARAARQAGDPQACLTLFRQGQAMWRGSPLNGLPSTPSLDAEATRLAEYRLATQEELLEAALATGQDGELVAELTSLIAQHPLRERLRALLMLALYRAGRQAEALRVFHDIRAALAEAMDIPPGPELSELHQQILRGDPELTALPRAEPRRNDLPRDISDFTGRESDLRDLVATLSTEDAQGTVIIEAMDGMAGVGKTALAVHAAHLLADRYPDAQLFIDLHAHAEGQQPTEPGDALNTLLRALNVPGDRIPDDVAGRSALWRAELAGRKVLVVLDNAVDAAQVRPLLPGASGCLALVTSRRRLADLDAARSLSLDVMHPTDAAVLFDRVLGDVRAAADPHATAEVLALCGYLPLAIRIAAARLRARPAWTTAHLAGRLRDERRRLGELKVGDRCVAGAFALSHRYLTTEQQRLFQLLGLVPGPDFDVHLAAAVSASSLTEAEQLLEDLVDVHLLQQSTPGRYHFHDLMRQHARDTAHDTETAVVRMLDYYLHTSGVAAGLVLPDSLRITIKVTHPPEQPPRLSTYDEALAWQETEYPNLLSAIGYAAEHGWHTHTWQLPHTLWRFFHIRGHYQEWITTHHLALAATEHLSDPFAHAETLEHLGTAFAWSHRYDEALDHLGRALVCCREIDHGHGEAGALNNLGLVYGRLGCHDEAIDHHERALLRCQEIGDRNGESATVNNLGIAYARVGKDDQALDHLLRALALYREFGDRSGESAASNNLGFLYARAGRYDEALDHLHRALDLYRAIGNRYGEGGALKNLGFVSQQLGHYDEALDYLHGALDLLRAIGDHVMESEVLSVIADTRQARGSAQP